jgi:hypothetical protein
MMTHACVFPLVLLLAAAPVAAHANDSTYTDLDTDRCKTLSQEEEGASIVLECKGLKDQPVIYKEGDLRQAILYGKASKAYIDGTYETFGPFNYTGRRIEWRLDMAGMPFAAIQRWYISNSGAMEAGPAPADTGQVLVVSKVAGADGKSCVIGYVDALANPDPNVLAREIADTRADGFRCGMDIATFHGIRGPYAADPMRSFQTP